VRTIRGRGKNEGAVGEKRLWARGGQPVWTLSDTTRLNTPPPPAVPRHQAPTYPGERFGSSDQQSSEMTGGLRDVIEVADASRGTFA
jgi:hypothetical protein